MVLADSDGISRVPPYSGVRFIEVNDFWIRGFHPLWQELSWSFLLINYFLTRREISNRIPQPPADAGFRLFPVRSPLLRKSLLFSLPAGTEMFHFPALSLTTLYIQVAVIRHYSDRVVPLGNLRIYGCLHLPEAFRSLPRPSSTTHAEASPVCPYYLNQSLILIQADIYN